MRKVAIVVSITCAVLLIGGYMYHRHYVSTLQKKMKKDIVTYLELQGEKEENIKEMRTEIYFLKNFKFVNVVFEDEEDVNYVFQYSKGPDKTSIKYSSASKVATGSHIQEEQELKHQNLRKSSGFELEG